MVAGDPSRFCALNCDIGGHAVRERVPLANEVERRLPE